jgi:hypothetical protein
MHAQNGRLTRVRMGWKKEQRNGASRKPAKRGGVGSGISTKQSQQQRPWIIPCRSTIAHATTRLAMDCGQQVTAAEDSAVTDERVTPE